MAVVENITTEVGDVMVIKVEVPILGLVLLSDFIDNVVGETASSYFTKEFRYAVDGINWSAWMNLTTENVDAIQVEPTSAFKVEYRYIHSGTIDSNLEFEDVTLQGEYIDITCTDAFNNSIFAQYFDCNSIEVLNWCLNVLEKLYKDGIIPKYIERNQNNNVNWEDRDFIDIWRTVTCYFAVIVTYARQFRDFQQSQLLLTEYLRQRGLFLCDDLELSDLDYLMNNFYDEIRKRGTLQVGLEKTDDLDESDSSDSSDSSTTPPNLVRYIDGELLRLICKRECDEFIYCLAESHKVGWNINNSSPLFRGTNFFYNAIKGYENSQEFIDLSKYPIFNSQYCSIVATRGGSLQIDEVPDGVTSGILSSPYDSNYAIKVNIDIDYEISFWVLVENSNIDLLFGCRGYDVNGNFISLESVQTGGSQSTFLSNFNLNQKDQWYFVRGIIYNRSQANLSSQDAQLNIGQSSKNLRFPDDDNICSIIPILLLDNDTGGTSQYMKIWDFKIRPATLESSNCYLGIKNVLVSWLENNNGLYSDDDITEIMRRYLVPYNCAIKNEFI